MIRLVHFVGPPACETWLRPQEWGPPQFTYGLVKQNDPAALIKCIKLYK